MTWKISLLLTCCLLVLPACGLREALVKRERIASAHYQYGIAFLADNPSEILRARIEFQKATELDPNNLEAHYALGHVHFILKRYKDSIASFEQALSIDPDYSEAHNYLGKIYASRGRYDQAILSYESALRNSKYETPEAPYWNLALVFMRQKKYKYAIQALNNTLLFKPSTPSVHNLLGKIYSSMGDHQKAISAYQKAVQLTPDDVNAHYGLACAYQRRGDIKRSETEFSRVLTLSPELQDQDDLRTCLLSDN